jgi:hypothetical protein
MAHLIKELRNLGIEELNNRAIANLGFKELGKTEKSVTSRLGIILS